MKAKKAGQPGGGLVAAALGEVGEPRHFDLGRVSPQGWDGDGWHLFDPQIAEPEPDRERGGAPVPVAPLAPWALLPPAPEPEPSHPLTPSRPDQADPAVRSPLGSDAGAAFKRGILIHRLLQTLPDLEPAVRSDACRRYLARPGHELDARQREEIAAETLAVLDDPRFAHLFGPDSRAEVPVTGIVGGRVLSGQIDRLAVTGQAVWIVDYKTNRPPPLNEADVAPVYLRQMAAYRAALTAIYPGRPIRCVLAWTDGPRLMELSDGVLDGVAV